MSRLLQLGQRSMTSLSGREEGDRVDGHYQSRYFCRRVANGMSMSENGQSNAVVSLHLIHGPRCRKLLPSADRTRRSLRRLVLRWRDDDGHILPAGVPGADAAPRALPLL